MAIYMEASGPSQDQESDLESLSKFPTFEGKPSEAKERPNAICVDDVAALESSRQPQTGETGCLTVTTVEFGQRQNAGIFPVAELDSTIDCETYNDREPQIRHMLR
nr:hypothetical protein CFP56_05919 [Quercus suber]